MEWKYEKLYIKQANSTGDNEMRKTNIFHF